jgi:hypothetical protein
MARKVPVENKGGKLEFTTSISARSCRSFPDLDAPADCDCEMASGRGESEGGDGGFEGEMMDRDPAGEVGQDSLAIFVDGEQEVAPR